TKDLEAVLRDAVKDLPEKDRSKVHWDAEKAGSVSVHRVDGMQEADAEARKFLGEGPVYLAFRSDALLVTAGGDALAAVKEALAAKPGPASPVRFEIALAHLATFMAKDQKAAPRVAEQVFANNKDGDRMQMSLEGGQALRARFQMKTALIQFFSQL